MKKIIQVIRNLWNDPRAEFSREVHKKEKDERYVEREKNALEGNIHLFI